MAGSRTECGRSCPEMGERGHQRLSASIVPPSPEPSERHAPSWAQRARAFPDQPGLRLRTPADVFGYARVERGELRPGATEIPARGGLRRRMHDAAVARDEGIAL